VIGSRGIAAEAREERRAHIRTEGPSHGRINIILIIRSVDPGDGLGVPVGRISGRGAELLNENRIGSRHGRHEGVPPTRRHALVVIDVRGIEDAVAGGLGHGVARGQQGRKVIGITQPADDADVVGAGGSNRVDDRLKARRGEITRGAWDRSAALQEGPSGGIGLIVDIEEDRRIVRVGRGHRGPEGHRVHVRHGLLAEGSPPTRAAGSGGRGSLARPMEIQVQVNIVVGTIVDDGLDHGAVGGLIGGPVGIRAAEPVILVEGKTDTVGVPDLDRFRNNGNVIGHDDAADGRRGTAGPSIPGWAIFHPGNIHP